jgi:hypothetical protein
LSDFFQTKGGNDDAFSKTSVDQVLAINKKFPGKSINFWIKFDAEYQGGCIADIQCNSCSTVDQSCQNFLQDELVAIKEVRILYKCCSMLHVQTRTE